MYNVFTQCDFTHTFDELFEFAKELGLTNEERRSTTKNLYDYFMKETAATGFRCPVSIPDRRTKAGKIVGELRTEHGLSNALDYSHKYHMFCRWENRMIKQEA